jgi:peptidoglycan hydrolase-like protein with peptidoglycan-binding domain
VDDDSQCSGGQTCSSGTCIGSEEDLAPLYAQIARLQQQIADLQQQLAAKIGAAAGQTFSCNQITKNLSYGITNDPQVKCLQEVLKAQGLFNGTVTGNYFNLTKDAVAAFQERYAGEILTPYHLTRGTGSVGAATRAKINRLIAQ